MAPSLEYSIVAEAPTVLKTSPTVTVTSALTTDDYVEYETKYCAKALDPLRIVISRAQGANVWDLDGKKYIDFLSSFSVVNQGHCHPRMVQAMITQCQKCTITTRAFHNELYPVLCKKLCDMFSFDMAFAMNSGSEATDLAIKTARKWGYQVKGIPQDQALVLTLAGNYHGKTLGPLSGSSNSKIRAGFGPYLPGVGPDVSGKAVRPDNIQDLKRAFESHGHRIAGFMMECVQGYAGCLPASNSYIKAASELCKKHNILFICDEIQSGFGRTGYMMAYQAAEIQPDMVILGKALTGGFCSMSMILGRTEVMSQLGSGEHSSTYSGNPLASAVAIEAIDVVVEEELSQRSARLGAELKARLEGMQSRSPFISAVSGRGLFMAVTVDESHPSGKVTVARLLALMMQRGVLAYAAANRVRIAPALMIPEKDLWDGVDIVERSLADLLTIGHIEGE